ncbi:hypothetical protein CVT24_011503 [Panaeolus cyanescens]|uniref:F-box domain-containing protein n=1 Tax=Panaeolus cyanescens TaxID=181874 RepID=A0A409VGM8_9AGAR|nr:hypothetical protein CVT24_011503 [Panaeolus cyanescens]
MIVNWTSSSQELEGTAFHLTRNFEFVTLAQMSPPDSYRPPTKKTSSAFSILNNPKFVSAIFQFLDFNVSCSRSRQACLKIGLTSKALLPYALDILWRELFHLDRLIQILPDVKAVEFCHPGEENLKRQLFLDVLLVPSMLERLKFYSRRVKVFYHQEKTSTNLFTSIDPSIIMQIVSLLPSNEPLFPSLQTLHLSTPLDRSRVVPFTPHISRLFLSPSLESVSFRLSGTQLADVDTHSPNVWLFLQGITRTRPEMLQNLDLGFVLPPQYLAPCFSSFTSLEFLKLPTGGHSREILRHVAGLPNLLSLSVTLGEWKSNSEADRESHMMTFERLRILSLDADVESTRALLFSFHFPCLEKLDLSHIDRDMMDEGYWEGLVENIASSLPHLCSLSFDYRSRDPKNGLQSYQAFPWRCFEHTIYMPFLTDLVIKKPKVESLSNDDFSCMAHAWPHLVHLNIATEKLGDIDFRVLIMAESRLRHLRSLELSIQMAGAWVPIAPIAPHELRSLRVPFLLRDDEDDEDEDEDYSLRLSMEEQCEIADFLDTLFPMLDTKTFYKDKEKERSGLGPCMDKLVTRLQHARRRQTTMFLRDSSR